MEICVIYGMWWMWNLDVKGTAAVLDCGQESINARMWTMHT